MKFANEEDMELKYINQIAVLQNEPLRKLRSDPQVSEGFHLGSIEI